MYTYSWICVLHRISRKFWVHIINRKIKNKMFNCSWLVKSKTLQTRRVWFQTLLYWWVSSQLQWDADTNHKTTDGGCKIYSSNPQADLTLNWGLNFCVIPPISAKLKIPSNFHPERTKLVLALLELKDNCLIWSERVQALMNGLEWLLRPVGTLALIYNKLKLGSIPAVSYLIKVKMHCAMMKEIRLKKTSVSNNLGWNKRCNILALDANLHACVGKMSDSAFLPLSRTSTTWQWPWATKSSRYCHAA